MIVLVRTFLFLLLAVCIAVPFNVVKAQDAEAPADGSQPEEKPKPKPPSYSIDDLPSLFFTYWQHIAIKDAKNSRGVSRPLAEGELDAIERGDQDIRPKPTPEEREIVLGGIVFVNEKEWTLWMNGKRVTPEAVPKEALDLRVYKDYIEVKWLDDYTNQIFPIRMRAHQRFNMDTRIFLPG